MGTPTTPRIGAAYRHIRAHARRDVLDFRFAGLHPGNRWNEPGEPTLYLAGDPGVLIAEWGRQFDVAFIVVSSREIVERQVYRLHVRLEAVLDLRKHHVMRELGRDDAPSCFLDRDLARLLARFVRESTAAQAILVPSVAFLDDLTRWNLVVFLDKLPADPHVWIQRVETAGPLRWGGEG